VQGLPELTAGLPDDALICLLDAYIHAFFEPAQLARFTRLVAELGRERGLDWVSLDPLVPLGPHVRAGVIGVDAPRSILERSRAGGVFRLLSRLAYRDGRSERSLLALGHPSGAWLEWLDASG